MEESKELSSLTDVDQNMSADDECVTLAHLPWEDIIFRYIFPKLDIKTLFILGSTSSLYREMIERYFGKIKIIDVGLFGAKISEKALAVVLKHNSCCQKLILRDCRSSLNDKILEPMLENNGQLTHIDLKNCTSLTNNSLQTLAVNCKNIIDLSLRDCVWASPAAVTNVGLHCNRIVTLDLSGCWNIDDNTVSVISQYCGRLAELNISRIYGITDASVKLIARNCKNIRKLYVRECWRLTDRSMQAILEYCKGLKLLQIKGCRSVTWRMMAEFRKKGVLLDSFTAHPQHHYVRSAPPFQM